jgi:RsiW-degrading membrane proteinase PrsW (M82 family)
VKNELELPASPPTPTPTSPTRNPLAAGGVCLTIFAALLLACGMCSVLFYLILPLTNQTRTNAIETNVGLGALAGMGILFGAVLLWQGVGTLTERGMIQAARVFPRGLVFVVLFLLAVALGAGALWLQSLAKSAQSTTIVALVFPPWHVIAASIPPLAFLAYAARRLGAASGLRALLVSVSWGALGATLLAIIAELLIAVVFFIVAAIAISLAPNSQSIIQQLQSQIALARAGNNYAELSRWMNDPAVLGVILLYAAVLVPFIEEALKTLVVAFVDPRRTRLADALLWGMSAGAGFALFENLFNTSAVLSLWTLTIILRIGATIMHVANGATMGRGWYSARVERRWSRLFIAYIVCVFFHAAWNAVALLLSTSAAFYLDRASAPVGTALPAASLTVALFVVLLVLASLGWVWIVYSVRSAPSSLPQQIAERSE